jgi:hypothetical protein
MKGFKGVTKGFSQRIDKDVGAGLMGRRLSEALRDRIAGKLVKAAHMQLFENRAWIFYGGAKGQMFESSRA